VKARDSDSELSAPSIAAMSGLARRSLILLVMLALALGACSGAGPTFGGALAAKVGHKELTNQDLEDEVEAWAANPDFLRAIGLAEVGEAGRRDAGFTAFVLTHRVISEQARLLGQQRGRVVSRSDVESMLDAILTDLPSFGDYSVDFQEAVAEDLAYQDLISELIDPASSEPVAPVVQVNPRYGNVVQLEFGFVQIDPPSGPLQSSM
jgi:hypothetical protein